MRFLKLMIISLVLLFILTIVPVGLLYYGSMKAMGKGDIAKEQISEAISSTLLPDKVKTVSDKAKSGLSRLSEAIGKDRKTEESDEADPKKSPKIS